MVDYTGLSLPNHFPMKPSTALSATLIFAVTSFSHAGNPEASSAAVAPSASSPKWEISAGAAAGELNLKWDFHSTFGYETNPLQDELSDQYVTPTIDFRRVITESDRLAIRLGVGYSYADASWRTGEHDAGEIGEEPNEFYAIDIAYASLSLHRIAAYVDVAYKLDALELGLRAGPTINLFDSSIKASHENFQHINPGELGVYRSGEVVRESASEVAIGASAEVFARYTLPSTNVFIEVSGGYNWTDSQRVGSSNVGVELDAASWRAGVSIGFKF